MYKLILFLLFLQLVNSFDEKQFGYYAFDIASRYNQVPPRVRKPPYVQSTIPCPGIYNDKYLSNKNTLCGDLNRGFVYMSPINVLIQNQHYPFELIKNKTLHFLAKTLPHLKEDHENIPKVFKVNQNDINNQEFNKVNYNNVNQDLSLSYRVKRELKEETTTELNLNETNVIVNNHNGTSSSVKKFKGIEGLGSSSDSKNKPCEQSNGILCHVMNYVVSSAKSNSNSGSSNLLNTLSQTIQAYNTAQNIGSLAQILAGSLDKNDNNEKNGNEHSSSRPILSQVINAISTLSNSGSTTPSPSSSTTNNSVNNYNPLGAIFDYFNSGSNNGFTSSILQRRKKPAEVDDIYNGMSASSSSVSTSIANAAKTDESPQVTPQGPTVCPAIEEYVAPVYARNYQGIWKYVVQIPNEGYFTQTVQKTSCVKGKCDYIDGSCKESSRWVSLLVAEVYYPSLKQSLNTMVSTVQNNQHKPVNYNLNPLNTNQNFNEMNNKLNQRLSYSTVPESSMLNYDIVNSLAPNYNEPNQFDQTFARRASNPTLNKVSANSYHNVPSASYPLPQYQEYNQLYNPNQNLQINQRSNQVYNNVNQNLIPNQNIKNQNMKMMQVQAKALQFQQLLDFYQQQYFKQQLSQQQSTNLKNQAFNSLDNMVSSASMLYPVINSIQHTNENIKVLNDQKQNQVKPRSFESNSNSNILDTTLYKNNYLNKDGLVSNNYNFNENASNTPEINDQSNNSPKNINIENNKANLNILNNSNNSKNNNDENNSRGNAENEEECDGYDNNGCYIIRVHYDYFLVPGSCNCHVGKKSSFDTLKKMFTG